MVVLVKCNWANSRKSYLCRDKLSNTDNNDAATAIRTGHS